MSKRTIGSLRLGNFNAIGAVALLVGVLGSACTVDDLAEAEPFTPAPEQEPEVQAPHGNPAGSGESVSAKIDNSTGGEITMADGTKIEVPAGALPPEVDTITVTSSPTPAPGDYKAVSPVFVFEPDGTSFLKPLKVTIPFTAAAGTETSKLTILWSRQRGDGFDMVPTTFAPQSGGFAGTAEVTHFSMGMVGEKYTIDPRPAPDPYADE